MPNDTMLKGSAPMPEIDTGFGALYSLKEAVAALNIKGLTVNSLRTEIRKGRLTPMRIAGKLVVSEQSLREMLVKCRDQESSRGSTSDEGRTEPQSGSSLMERERSALNASKAILKELRRPSQTTSPKNGDPAAIVIPLNSQSQKS